MDTVTSDAPASAPQPMDEWNTLPWTSIQKRVFKLQKRIYQASSRGNVKAVHRLQRLLMRSWSARCLAVRRVTQDNQGKRTAGVDGVKSLDPPQRRALAANLRPDTKASPTRRVWIPKPGTTEKRPLGIPTMRDRAAQALVKLALEPEWEAKFEPNSYGFRPGRSCHDAAQAIWIAISRKPKYVLDADIAKCFDRIDHAALLRKLATFPALRRVIRGWLKAGVMDGGTLFPTDEGTPQGGVISPLLANVALHGLETSIQAAFPRSVRQNGRVLDNWKPLVVRYADDFVAFHEDLAIIEQVRQITAAWLKGMGLELKPSKTRVVHTLDEHDGRPGFDFLGFHVRSHRVGKNHTGKSGGHHPVPLGFKTLITPSKDAQHRHQERLAEIIRRHRTAPQEALIAQLNPVIRGWTRYHSANASKRTFSRMYQLLFAKLVRWAKRRHQKKPWKWIARKYWRLEQGRWTFAPKDGKRLSHHARTPIVRHVKVRGTKSPYDGDWAYWSTRLGTHPEIPKRVGTLMKWQKGRCARCGLYFTPEDLPEIDHIIPKSQGGKDGYINWQLLHRHCHDEKTATDGSYHRPPKRGICDQDQTVEEPDEAKASRPVLEAGGR